MNFEKVFDKHKEDLTQALVLFGEGVRVNKLLADEESKRQEYYKFYEEGYKAGQQSKQQEVDNLKAIIMGALQEHAFDVDYDEYRFVGRFIDVSVIEKLIGEVK